MDAVAWGRLIEALALMMVLEGLLPFLSPGRLREALLLVVRMDDRSLRLLGLTSMVLGVLLLYAMRP